MFERFAREYGWTPAVCRRLTIRQIQTFWQAMHARYTGEQEASRAAAPTPRGRGRAPVEQSQTADGRTVRRYNLLSMWDRTRGSAASG